MASVWPKTTRGRCHRSLHATRGRVLVLILAGAIVGGLAPGQSEATDEASATVTYVNLARQLDAVLIHVARRDDTTWYDDSGNNLHGTLVNTPSWNPRGGPGTGVPGYFDFDPTAQQFIDVGDPPELRFAGPFSLVWWQRTDGDPQSNDWAQIIGKGHVPGYMVRHGRSAATSAPRDLNFSLVEEEVVLVPSPSGFAPDDEWVMLMGRYTGSVVDFWYIADNGDPVLISSRAFSGLPIPTNDKFLYAARDRTSTDQGVSRWWRGHLAGALAFDYAIETSAFQDLYTATIEGPSIEDPPISESGPALEPASEPEPDPGPAREPPPAREPEPDAEPAEEPLVDEPEPSPTAANGRGRYALVPLLGTRSSGVVRLAADGSTHTIISVEIDERAPSQLRLEVRSGTCTEPGALLIETEPILAEQFTSQTRVGVPLRSLELGGFVLTITLRATNVPYACTELRAAP
jgi:hypothetical protein